LDRLVDREFLEETEDKYKLTKEGLDEVSKVLTEGAQLWYMDK
jgi:tRNA U34 5-methylaminomethyl-2-thiouridine-forming methyltransferase MnmC